LAALLLLCTTSGRRTGEAIRCVPDDFDPQRGTLLIGKDKLGNPRLIQLARQVIEALEFYDWQQGPGLFRGYTPRSRRNVFRDLKRACKRAGVPYHTPHKAGRHAFAKRFLEAGYSIAHLMGAGGWRDPKMPTKLYGHFAYSEVAQDAKRVGEDFLSRINGAPKLINPPTKGKKAVTERLQRRLPRGPQNQHPDGKAA
jgi:integrase